MCHQLGKRKIVITGAEDGHSNCLNEQRVNQSLEQCPSAPVKTGGPKPVSGHRSSTPNDAAVQALNGQVRELRAHLEGLETERDFYFEKLRSIEILIQPKMEALEAGGQVDETLREIQKILYSTEEGFQVPEGEGTVDEEETF
ncbi:hypothetical protein B0H13DRAFT_2412786 [Mycena leptocephala]|nr:hypothetical protein B0H13DRAFT_2412786 [Mycena leptocephala]